MIIGIPVSRSKTQFYINAAYVEYVRGVGMDPFLIMPDNKPEEVVKLCDGLILPGGCDIDPTHYSENNESSNAVDENKDEFERTIARVFINASKPVFGICRGFQLLAREYLKAHESEDWLVFLQHINYHTQTDERKALKRTSRTHSVVYSNELYDGKSPHPPDRMFVNSMHHQCLVFFDQNNRQQGKKKSKIKSLPPAGKPNSDLKILAYTKLGLEENSPTHVIEAFRIENQPSRIMAVQWHPEELMDYALIQAFFGAEVVADDRKVEVRVFDSGKEKECQVITRGK